MKIHLLVLSKNLGPWIKIAGVFWRLGLRTVLHVPPGTYYNIKVNVGMVEVRGTRL